MIVVIKPSEDIKSLMEMINMDHYDLAIRIIKQELEKANQSKDEMQIERFGVVRDALALAKKRGER